MNRIVASLLITLQFLTAIIFGQVNVKLLPVRVDGKWGYIDTTGSVIIKPKFDKAQFFTNDDYAVISKDGLVGIIDLKGTMILEPYYEDLKIIDENRIGFRKDSLWGMIDKSGKMIMPLLFNDINKIEENHYTVRLGNKYGIIDNMGKVLVKPYYDGVIPFSNSFFISVSGNFKGLHNFNGQQLLSTECEEIISVFDDYIMYKVNGLWGCINIDGQILVEPKWITYKALNKHFIKLLKNGKWSLYCTASQKLISDTLHQNFYHFNQDYVQYFYENRFGILDKNGDNVLQPLYYEIAPTSIHLFKTKTMGGWGLVKKGDIRVVSNEYDEIGDFYSNVTKVSQNEFYGLINSRGSVLAATKYTNIEMVNNVVKAYRGKERKVIYINDNGNIINKSDYKNVLSIYVGSKKITNPRAVIQRTVMKSSSDFGWYVCPSSGKWGLKNNKSDYNIVPPEYDYITVNSELGLTLVEVRSNNKYVLGDKEFSIRSRYGLVDHINGKFLAGPNFWEIRWEDFLQGDDHVARCIRVGGKHGIMKRNGTALYGKSTYIDDFINGYARFNIGGKLTSTSKDSREVLSSVT
ncbi:MAG: WG repeat-containing protein, partial [Bacteroidia bacterium]|nr:WG repeat-containing protein [Bacteroidia bacterium]